MSSLSGASELLWKTNCWNRKKSSRDSCQLPFRLQFLFLRQLFSAQDVSKCIFFPLNTNYQIFSFEYEISSRHWEVHSTFIQIRPTFSVAFICFVANPFFRWSHANRRLFLFALVIWRLNEIRIIASQNRRVNKRRSNSFYIFLFFAFSVIHQFMTSTKWDKIEWRKSINGKF